MGFRSEGLGDCENFVPMKKAVFWDRTPHGQPPTKVSKSQLHPFSGFKTGIFELGNISKQPTSQRFCCT